MDAKARKVLNGLTKLGGEQEVFDLSIALKMTEDTVQALLGELSGEGLASCRRDDGGKEFWSVAEARPAPPPEPGAKEPAAGKKKGKATAAGPDDRFDEFIVDAKAAPDAVAAVSPPPAPAPIIQPEPAEFDSFEPKPSDPGAKPAKGAQEPEDNFEPKPPKKEKRAKNDDDSEPKPEKPAKPPKKKAPEPDDGSFEPKPAKEGRAERELSAGPDDHFDEFAERVPSKPNLPIPLIAGAATLVLIVILFIVGGGGGKTKMINDVKADLTNKLDSLKTETAAEIAKLRAENKALGDEIKGLRAELRKAASQNAAKSGAAADKPKTGKKK